MPLDVFEPNPFTNFLKQFHADQIDKFGILIPIEDFVFKESAWRRWQGFTDAERENYRSATFDDVNASACYDGDCQYNVIMLGAQSFDDEPSDDWFRCSKQKYGKKTYRNLAISPCRYSEVTTSDPSTRRVAKVDSENDHVSIPEQLPDVDDIHPEAPVPVPELYEMINVAKSIDRLNSCIRNEYITFPYCIASSNVFVKNGKVCIPAEIGITKFSFKNGILGQLHSLVDPGKDIPVVEVPDMLQFSAEFHKIPHEGMGFPPLTKLLTDLHAFTHTVHIDVHPEAFIFTEYEEMEQMRDIFTWFQGKSKELELELEWYVHFISLRTLFAFLVGRLPISNLDESDALEAFNTARFDYTDLCYFHEHLNCRHCAISKAFIYCYILSDYFANSFGVKKLKQLQNVKGSWQYVPNSLKRL